MLVRRTNIVSLRKGPLIRTVVVRVRCLVWVHAFKLTLKEFWRAWRSKVTDGARLVLKQLFLGLELKGLGLEFRLHRVDSRPLLLHGSIPTRFLVQRTSLKEVDWHLPTLLESSMLGASAHHCPIKVS